MSARLASMPLPVEVRHSSPGEAPLVRLLWTPEGFCIEHLLTGEQALLPQGGDHSERWKLSFNDGWGLLSKDSAPSVWVNALLTKSVWCVADKFFVQTMPRRNMPDTPTNVEWLTDLLLKHKILYASWKAEPGIAKLGKAKLLEAEIPRHGAKLFISLRDIQQALEFYTPWCANNRWIAKQMSLWTNDLEFLGIPGDHIFRPLQSASASCIVVHEFMASCCALLAILCRCAAELRNAHDRESSIKMLAAFAKVGLRDGELVLRCDIRGLVGAAGISIIIKHGIVSWEADFGTSFREVSGTTVQKFLVAVWGVRQQAREFASEVFMGAGSILDQSLRAIEWTDDPLQVMQQQARCPRRRADRVLRTALLEFPGNIARRASRASALARRMGLVCPLAQSWHDGAYMRRYLLSVRQAMHSGISFGVTPDKSGFPPDEFLGSSILNMATGKIAWMPPQAVRAFRVRPEEPGAAVTSEHIKEWRRQVETFLESEAGASAEHATSHAKWQRLQSYDLLAALDWQLQCSVGGGLALFCPDAPVNILSKRPRLTICWDAGPDNMCTSSFMLNCKSMRLSIFFDPPHKLWRCVWSGCQERISVVFLGGIVCNLDRGPWKSERNWKKLQEAMREYLAHSDYTCPLFRRLAPRILADRGQDPTDDRPETLKSLFDSLPDAAWLRQKAPKVATTRWGTWHNHWTWLLPQYHEKLLGCMACGIAEGWLNKEQQSKYAEALKVVDSGELADTLKQKTSVREGMRKTQKLRDGMPNQMRLSTLTMMDPSFYAAIRLLHMTSKPFNELYSEWNRTLRSIPATMNHHLTFVKGTNPFFSAIAKCFRPFDDADSIAAMGIETCLFGSSVLRAPDDIPELLDQRDKCKELWLAVFAQCRSFFKGFMPMYLGYPGKFAHLLDPCPRYRAAHWEDMVKDWRAWEAVGEAKGGVLGRMRKLSPFGWREVEEIFEWAGMFDMALTPEVLEVVRQMFSYQGSSLSTEISFQKISDSARDSKSGRQSAPSVWRRPVRDRLLSTEFFFDEVSAADVADDMPAKLQLPVTITKPNYAKASVGLKDIAGKRPPSWSTFSAASFDGLAVHVQFIRWLADTKGMAKADQSWKSELLHINCVFVDKLGTKYLSLVTVPPMVGLLQIEEVVVGKTGFLKLLFESLLPVWVSCIEVNDWLGQPFEFICPLDMMRASSSTELLDFSGVFGKATSRPIPLLEFAARHAFFNLNEASLDRLAIREFGMALDGTIADKIIQLINKNIKCDDDLACSILETRMKQIENSANGFDELARTSECAEHIDEADEGSLKSHLLQMENNKKNIKDMQQKINNTLAKALPKVKRRKMVQTDLPDQDDQYTYENVIGFFPKSIQVKLRKDYFNGRWQAWWRRTKDSPWHSMSRSWGSRSHKECLVDLLRASWEMPAQLGEVCPIKGIA